MTNTKMAQAQLSRRIRFGERVPGDQRSAIFADVGVAESRLTLTTLGDRRDPQIKRRAMVRLFRHYGA